MCIRDSTKILIARISNPYGPGQDFNKGVGFIDAAIKKTIRGEKIEIWGDGNNVRDYIYIDDVCRMLISLFNYQGNYDTFNISSNTGTSQRDIIRMLEEMHLAPEVVYQMCIRDRVYTMHILVQIIKMI